LKTSPNAIEQTNTQLSLKREDLPRCCWLRQAQAPGSTCKTAGVGDQHERVEMAEVHIHANYALAS
jgi:hypothetical protein